MRIRVYNDWDQIPKAEAEGEEEAVLAWDGEYRNNDVIDFDHLTPEKFYVVKVDATIEASLVYITSEEVRYRIPFNEKKSSYNPLSFIGNRHYISIRAARPEEVHTRHNLALNPFDQHEETVYDGTNANHRRGAVGGLGTASGEGTGAGGTIQVCGPHVFPHASANVETRGEAVFAARNAIDGVISTTAHGEWPYESWGINRRDDAQFRLDFGCPVNIDEIRLYTRADFPHDNWWTRGTLRFSDGSSLTFPMEKLVQKPHVLPGLKLQGITWLTLGDLVQAEDPSLFPALTQIEVYGTIQ